MSEVGFLIFYNSNIQTISINLSKSVTVDTRLVRIYNNRKLEQVLTEKCFIKVEKNNFAYCIVLVEQDFCYTQMVV